MCSIRVFLWSLFLLVFSSLTPSILLQAQDSPRAEIGLYRQEFVRSTDSGRTTTPFTYLQGFAYSGARTGVWGFAYTEPGYASLSLGPFFDISSHGDVGIGLGSETVRGDDGLWKAYGRVAVNSVFTFGRFSFDGYYEDGASRSPWYRVDIAVRATRNLSLSAFAQTPAGKGGRVVVNTSRDNFRMWVAPLYQNDTKRWNLLVGAEIIFRKY